MLKGFLRVSVTCSVSDRKYTEGAHEDIIDHIHGIIDQADGIIGYIEGILDQILSNYIQNCSYFRQYGWIIPSNW